MESIKESEVLLLLEKLKKFPVTIPMIFNWYVFHLKIAKKNKLEVVKRINRELQCGLKRSKDLYTLQLEPWFEMMEQRETEYQRTEF